MKTLPTKDITSDQLDEINTFALSGVSDAVRKLMTDLIKSIRDGGEITVTDKGDSLTPQEAAKRLGMSRTHLDKLLDRNELTYFSLGSHPRIRLSDFRAFESKLHSHQQEMAERFAHRSEFLQKADQAIINSL